MRSDDNVSQRVPFYTSMASSFAFNSQQFLHSHYYCKYNYLIVSWEVCQYRSGVFTRRQLIAILIQRDLEIVRFPIVRKSPRIFTISPLIFNSDSINTFPSYIFQLVEFAVHRIKTAYMISNLDTSSHAIAIIFRESIAGYHHIFFELSNFHNFQLAWLLPNLACEFVCILRLKLIVNGIDPLLPTINGLGYEYSS